MYTLTCTPTDMYTQHMPKQTNKHTCTQDIQNIATLLRCLSLTQSELSQLVYSMMKLAFDVMMALPGSRPKLVLPIQMSRDSIGEQIMKVRWCVTFHKRRATGLEATLSSPPRTTTSQVKCVRTSKKGRTVVFLWHLGLLKWNVISKSFEIGE